MKRVPLLGPAASVAVAALIGCSSTQDGPPTVIRSAAPQGYEDTINNFFAFRIPGPRPNAVIAVSAPEPGACPLGGYSASSRGWVVPTAYETRTRDASGKGAVNVTTKMYYFWFLGNTIAGISPRIELCPGVEMTFGEALAPAQVAEGSDSAKVAAGQKQEAPKEVKKTSPSRAVVRPPVKKSGSTAAKVNTEPTQTRGP